jgi:hypothetical protein
VIVKERLKERVKERVKEGAKTTDPCRAAPGA